MIVVIPATIGEYFITAGQSAQLQTLLETLSKLGTSPAPTFPVTSIPQLRELLVGELVIMIGLLVVPLAVNAIVANVDEILGGGRPSFRAGYAKALSRAPQIFGIIIFSFFIELGACAIVIALLAVSAVVIAGAYRYGTHSAVLLSILITSAIFLVAAMVVVLVLVGMSMTFASFATVVERKGVVDALGSGFERVFRRDRWKQVLLLAIVGFLISMLVSSFGGALQLVVAFAPGGQALGAILYALTLAVSTAATSVLYGVYYSDVRGRASAELP